MFKTPICSWKRAFKKYSPTKDLMGSPVIPMQGKVKPNWEEDNTLLTALWGLTTHEEFYYQNFIELISINKFNTVKTNRILKLNRLPSYWSKRLINFQVLGQGCFGRVYKTTDVFTDYNYALKEVTSYSECSGKLLKNTVMIMTERNAHFRANESPFVVKLHGAFQDKQLMAYWLIFEYCIGSLTTYISYIRNDIETYFDKFLNLNVLSEVYYAYLVKIDLDIEKVGFIYGFELLAGIDYLAQRNLLHNDLKPDNILVSERGHLKISDLGLTHRFRWLDRWSAIEFAEPTSFKTFEEKDKDSRFVGNFKYTDPEIQIFFNVYMSSRQIYSRFFHQRFPLGKVHQHFLTDLYGVALIMIDMLFAGMNIITTRQFTVNIAKRFNIDRQVDAEKKIWAIRCTYDRDVNKNFLERILDVQTTTKNISVMRFLKSCFLPRADRAEDYTKYIEHWRLKEKSKTRCIDIQKVKNIEYYRLRGFTEYNISTMEMPDILLKIFTTEPRPIIAETFDQLLSTIQRRTNPDEQELKMGAFEFAV